MHVAFENVKADKSSLVWNVVLGPNTFHVRKDVVVKESYGSFLIGSGIRGVPHSEFRWIGELKVATSTFP